MISDMIRNPQGMASQREATLPPDSVCTSTIVAAELRFGALKRGSTVLADKVEAALAALPVLPFQPPADEAYARVRLALELAGTPIGGNDILIAAHAVAEDCVLVSANEREFGRVPGLTTENWLRP